MLTIKVYLVEILTSTHCKIISANNVCITVKKQQHMGQTTKYLKITLLGSHLHLLFA